MIRRMALLAILLLAMFAFVPTATAQNTLYRDGAFLNIPVGACGLQGGGYNLVTLNANKIVDPINRSRVSTFDLYLTNGITPANLVYTLIGPITVGVSGDPDNLSVSRDLGWAGLDSSVSVFDKATNTTVIADVHVTWTANAGVVQEGGLYKRSATINGTITVRGQNFLMPACIKTGYIFSTREPKPRY